MKSRNISCCLGITELVMNYIHMFATEQEYDDYVSAGYTEPHVSYIVASGKIKYNINSHHIDESGEFKGTYENVSELNNVFANDGDYAYIKTIDQNGNEIYSKYIYENFDWSLQYTVSNTIFNANEWASIKSGITSSQVNKLDLLPNSDELIEMLGNKFDKIQEFSNGNFIAIDENGDLIDSGHKHSDYLTEHQSLDNKQDALISGTNIKTINNESILGEGNINITSSGSAEASVENTILIL